jgi:chemotaxis protein methyltransferase CheR
MRALLDSVTTNLTRFFRNTAHYDTFINFVIPDLVKRKQASGDKVFKIWSAGCSSGEEPYTKAMILSEYLPADFRIERTASDLRLKFPSDSRNLDVIFCRNVLIYFDELAQKNVIDGFWNALRDHSYLFIGHSESLFGMDTGFEFIKTDWACIYGKIKD